MSERYRVVQGFRNNDVRWTVYRGDRPVETFAARDVAEECARALNADLEAANPRHGPSEADAREAAQLFGDLAEDLAGAEFEAWINGLQSERFRQVTQAIDVLRGALAEYRGDVGLRDVAGWIDLDRAGNRERDAASDSQLADAHAEDRFDADVLADIEAYEAEAHDDP